MPFNVAEPTYTNTAPAPTLVLPQAFPTTGLAGPSTIGLPAAVNPNLKIPYSQQWNLTAEHERWGFGWRASYVGTVARQMVYNHDLNSPALDGQLYIQKARPFPKYPNISYTDNGASHSYNAMSLGIQRRMKSGLQIDSSYTWQRDIGDAGSALEDPFNRRRERAVEQSIPT